MFKGAPTWRFTTSTGFTPLNVGVTWAFVLKRPENNTAAHMPPAKKSQLAFFIALLFLEFLSA
jgi:hypothetical protein